MPAYRVAGAVSATEAPPIPRAQAWAATYLSRESAASDPILNLAQGVPGEAPHPTLLAALGDASSDPSTAGYGPILGEDLLRQALADEFNQLYRCSGPLKMDQIGVTTGCNMAFLVLAMVLCPPGSKVLMPLPAYFSQTMSLSLQSVEPVYMPCLPSQGFKPSLPAARRYLADDKDRNIRMIVLVTPSNPTGAIYSPSELREWYDLAKEFQVPLVLDETYRDFVYARPGEERVAPHDLFELEDWQDTLISLGSMSKGYRIPGHRLGSIIASPDLLESVTVVCDCMQASLLLPFCKRDTLLIVQICAPRPPQLALASVLPDLRMDLDASSAALSHRLALFAEIINRLPGWTVESKGGYYAYVQFPEAYLSQQSALGLQDQETVGSESVARYLAERLGVICLPGSFFMPDLRGEKVWKSIDEAGGGELRADRWLRFAIANVDDEVIVSLEPRLKRLNQLLGMS